MLKKHKINPRLQEIIADLNATGRLNINDLAEKYQLTTMTVRRDLQFLEDAGYLIQVKNGAVPRPKLYPESSAAEDNVHPVKNLLAEKILELIQNANTIMLSCGSTTLTVAQHIAASKLNLTVLTNSIPIASALFQSRSKVILVGGELRNNSMDLIGPAAEKFIQSYHVDFLISGCDGADCEQGFFTSDLNLANLEEKSVKIADKVLIVTESIKFKRKSLVNFAGIHDVNTLVCDDKLSEIDRALLSKGGIEIHLVR